MGSWSCYMTTQNTQTYIDDEASSRVDVLGGACVWYVSERSGVMICSSLHWVFCHSTLSNDVWLLSGGSWWWIACPFALEIFISSYRVSGKLCMLAFFSYLEFRSLETTSRTYLGSNVHLTKLFQLFVWQLVKQFQNYDITIFKFKFFIHSIMESCEKN